MGMLLQAGKQSGWRSVRLQCLAGAALSLISPGCAALPDVSAPCGPEPASGITDTAEPRPISVRDSIEMTRLAATGLDKPSFVWSPGRESVAFILQRGDLETNEVESVISWYSRRDLEWAADVRRECAWRVGGRFRSADNVEAVRQIEWLDEGQTLAALARGDDGGDQLYRIRLGDESGVEQLTDQAHSIHLFDMKGDRFVYIASDKSRDSRKDEDWQRGFALDSDASMSDLFDVSIGKPPGVGELAIFTGEAAKGEAAVRVGTGPVNATQPIRGIWLAPDGRHAITVLPAQRIPAGWERYDVPLRGFELTETGPREPVGHTAWQYVIVDLENAKVRARVDAPTGWHLGFRSPMQAYWSADGRTAVLSNTYLPLDVADPDERERRAGGAVIAALDIESGELTRLTALPAGQDGRVENLAWDAERAALTVVSRTSDGASSERTFDARSGHERSSPAPRVTSSPRLELKVEETLNQPPRIVLSANGDTSVLADLNPSWQALEIPEARPFNWIDESGHQWRGILVEPLDRERGQRYPLVIQTHGIAPDTFLLDGPIRGVTTTAYAARPLAAGGAYVLQMEDRRDVIMTPDEAPAHLRGYLGAVSALDEEGLIDTARVGLIGFSRTGYHVKYALAFSDFPFAAATAADGVDMGYLQYVLNVVRMPAIQREFEALNGGPPVDKNFDSWLDRAPPFNVHNVDTPLRIEALGPESVLSQWEMYALLWRLGKPVDMIYFPDGIHNLVKPWERLTSQQGNVDWFRYWLMDEQDADPNKAEQYRRWDELRRREHSSSPDSPSR